jgi:hypothetical protein
MRKGESVCKAKRTSSKAEYRQMERKRRRIRLKNKQQLIEPKANFKLHNSKAKQKQQKKLETRERKK